MPASKPVSIRPAASADRRAIWDWRHNNPFEKLAPGESNIDEATFFAWFDRCLRADDNVLLVANIQSVRIGVTWFRLADPRRWRMAAFIKPAFMGRNLTTPMIENAVAHFLEFHKAIEIIAIVPDINEHSGLAFAACGFEVSPSGGELIMRVNPATTPQYHRGLRPTAKCP